MLQTGKFADIDEQVNGLMDEQYEPWMSPRNISAKVVFQADKNHLGNSLGTTCHVARAKEVQA